MRHSSQKHNTSEFTLGYCECTVNSNTWIPSRPSERVNNIYFTEANFMVESQTKHSLNLSPLCARMCLLLWNDVNWYWFWMNVALQPAARRNRDEFSEKQVECRQ